jgi:hypothetical protein
MAGTESWIAGLQQEKDTGAGMGRGGIMSCGLHVGSWSALEKTKLVCEHTINFYVDGVPMKSSC